VRTCQQEFLHVWTQVISSCSPALPSVIGGARHSLISADQTARWNKRQGAGEDDDPRDLQVSLIRRLCLSQLHLF